LSYELRAIKLPNNLDVSSLVIPRNEGSLNLLTNDYFHRNAACFLFSKNNTEIPPSSEWQLRVVTVGTCWKLMAQSL